MVSLKGRRQLRDYRVCGSNCNVYLHSPIRLHGVVVYHRDRFALIKFMKYMGYVVWNTKFMTTGSTVITEVDEF
jgi:hypothetical protein